MIVFKKKGGGALKRAIFSERLWTIMDDRPQLKHMNHRENSGQETFPFQEHRQTISVTWTAADRCPVFTQHLYTHSRHSHGFFISIKIIHALVWVQIQKPYVFVSCVYLTGFNKEFWDNTRLIHHICFHISLKI